MTLAGIIFILLSLGWLFLAILGFLIEKAFGR